MAIWLGGLAGCAASPKPFEYESHRELKPGPGLFSGDNGYFTIYPQQDPSATDSPKDSQGKKDFEQKGQF